MKLIIAIVEDEDAFDLIEALNNRNFRVTKLSTSGGFLKSGNTTLMSGVEENKINEAIGIIKEICKKRKEIIITPTPLIGNESGYIQQCSIPVEVGGATVFVVDVDKFIRI